LVEFMHIHVLHKIVVEGKILLEKLCAFWGFEDFVWWIGGDFLGSCCVVGSTSQPAPGLSTRLALV